MAEWADLQPRRMDCQKENSSARSNHNLASANLESRIPRSGTRISANYGWVDSGAVIPRHVFTTQDMYISPGFNVMVRQPLPSFFGMPGRLELTGDLRNLLAQGYLPLATGDPGRLLVGASPPGNPRRTQFYFLIS